MNWIEIIKLGSVIFGIAVALYGIDSWRREHSGKRRIELAEDTLALFYEAVDAIKHIRSSFGFLSETEAIEKVEGETENQYQARKNASVVFIRYKEHQETFNKLHAMRFRFMAQIGKDKAQPFNDIRIILNKIASSARMLARLWSHHGQLNHEEQMEKHQRLTDKYESIFWEGFDEDPISPQLEKIINEIEQTCNSVILGEGTLYGFLNRKLKKS